MPVAVLIVNCRVYEDLDRVLASIEPHLREADEVVVFDQVSDVARLAECARRYPRVRMIPSAENVGFAAGVNRAARETTAPLLMLLNPDALVEEPVIDVLERWMLAHPDTAIVGPRVLNGDGTVQGSARRFPGPSAAVAGRSAWLTTQFPDNWLSRRNLPFQRTDTPEAVDWVAGSCLMTRRDVFDRLGGMDEGFFLFWEDADYCRRATALGYVCMYLPTVAVRHFGGRSVALDPALAIRAFHESAFRLYWKHSGPLGRVLAPVARAALWVRRAIRTRLVVARTRTSQAEGS